MKKLFRPLAMLIVIALLVGFPASTAGHAQDICYSLSVVVDGGKGGVPNILTSPNCPAGRYRANTTVMLSANPASGSSIYAWRGADNELTAARINTVTMTADKEVGIHYVQAGDPDRPVKWGKVGGVARVDAPTDPMSIIPEVVIGTDDRVQVTDTTTPTYRKNAYLTLFYDDGDEVRDDQCTGWFVGPRTVITAGHCLYNTDFPGSHWVSDVSVIPARNGTYIPYGHAHALEVQSVSGWVDSGLTESDYGVIQLGVDDDLGNTVGWYRYGYFSDAFLSSLTVTIAGYPGEKPLGTMWVDSDPITGVTSGTLQYTVDTNPGTSGSAVWYPSDSDVALAVHTRGDPPLYNHGTRITKGVAETFQAWGAATAPLTDCPEIGSPENISPAPGTTLTGSTVHFEWTAVANSSAYQFQLWDADLSDQLVDTGVDGTSHEAALPEGTSNWRVMAATGTAGCPDGEWSEFWSVTVDSQPPDVAVIAPNGGESWEAGTQQTIGWTAADPSGIANIALYYSTDGGASWTTIDEVEPDDGSESWLVPSAPTNQARVKVVAVDNAGHAGEDESDADFTITVPPAGGKMSFHSNGVYDGWLLESSQGSGTGGSLNQGAALFYVGDDPSNRQYRTLLSFNTKGLPEDAVVTRAVLKLKLDGITGTNPFNTHGGLRVDIRQPYFGSLRDLEISDFQAEADLQPAGTVRSAPTGGWYVAVLKSTAYPFINTTDSTQLRLRFAIDDNADGSADFLRFFSGNADPADQPVLVVEYVIP